METKVVRENTVKLKFGTQNRGPTNTEVFTFFRKHNWNEDMLSAMYKEDYSLLVKFRSKQLMLEVLASLGNEVDFEYEDGSKIKLAVSTACGVFKYVRVFGLPPEVDDKPIADVFGKFGNIHQMVRERFPVETGFPIWNGVRGIHMEVTAELPAQVFVQHIRARVYYDGFQNKCFTCGSTEHLKADCSKRTSVQSRLDSYAHPPVKRGGPETGPGIPNGKEQSKNFPVLPRSTIPQEKAGKEQRKEPEKDPADKEGGWVTIKSKVQRRGRSPRTADNYGSDQEESFKVPLAPKLAKLQSMRSRSLNGRKQNGNITAKELANMAFNVPSTSTQKSTEKMAPGDGAVPMDLK